MSNRQAWRHDPAAEAPPSHVIAWFGVHLVASSLMVHWPPGIGRNPGQVLVGRLGLDPLNTAWRHRQGAAGADLAAFPCQPWRAYRGK